MKLIYLLSFIIFALVVTSVTYSNHSLDDSARVQALTAEIDSLKKENTILAAEIAESGSLTVLADNIQAAGFVPASKIISVSLPSNVASR